MSGGVRRLAVAVLACDRPHLLEDTLGALHASDVPVGWVRDITLVDNSETAAGREAADRALARGYVDRLVRPGHNVGIAAGWNLAWAVMDTTQPFEGIERPDVAALVQEDVLLEPEWAAECIDALNAYPDVAVVSGYNSPKCQTTAVRRKQGLALYVKPHLPGVHLVARRDFWAGVFPLRTVQHHLGEDWEITRDSPGAPRQTGKVCGVLPGLAVHRGGLASTWNPEPHPEYADPMREVLADGTRSAAAALIDAPAGDPVRAAERPQVSGGAPSGGPVAVLRERATSPEGFGLIDLYGFRAGTLADARQALEAGQPVLLRGWSAEYAPLVEAYGRKVHLLWSSGFTGADLMGEDEALSQILRASLLPPGGESRPTVLWMANGRISDGMPGRAYPWAPIWSPGRLSAPLPEGEDGPRDASAVLVGPYGNPYSAPCKNGLAAVAALVKGDGWTLHLARAQRQRMPKSTDQLLEGQRVILHDWLDWPSLRRLLSRVAVMVHTSVYDTWPALPIAAVYAGLPVVVSTAIGWADRLPYATQQCAVVAPENWPGLTRRVRQLLSNAAIAGATVAEERRVLDAILRENAWANAALLRSFGFAVPEDKAVQGHV